MNYHTFEAPKKQRQRRLTMPLTPTKYRSHWRQLSPDNFKSYNYAQTNSYSNYELKTSRSIITFHEWEILYTWKCCPDTIFLLNFCRHLCHSCNTSEGMGRTRRFKRNCATATRRRQYKSPHSSSLSTILRHFFLGGCDDVRAKARLPSASISSSIRAKTLSAAASPASASSSSSSSAESSAPASSSPSSDSSWHCHLGSPPRFFDLSETSEGSFSAVSRLIFSNQ